MKKILGTIFGIWILGSCIVAIVSNSSKQSTKQISTPSKDIASPMGNWKSGEWLDELTKARFTMIQLDGAGGEWPHKYMLSIRCHETKLEVFADLRYLGEDKVKVSYKIGDKQVVSEMWSTSTERDAVFAANPRNLSGRLFSSESLVLRTWDFAGTQITATFDLTGIAEAKKNLHCIK